MSKSFFFILLSFLFSCKNVTESTSNDIHWANYLGDASVSHFSKLDQINTANVQQLQVAWTYHCGDGDLQNRTQIQCNPLVIDGILYGSTPRLKFFALDAANGDELWKFDPFAEAGYDQFGMGVNRGLKDLRIIEAIYKAMETGKRVAI